MLVPKLEGIPLLKNTSNNFNKSKTHHLGQLKFLPMGWIIKWLKDFFGQSSHAHQVSVSHTQPIYQPQGQSQATNSHQGPGYQIVGSFPSSTSNDEILNKLQEMEQMLNIQGKFKVSYGSICNELIHPSIPIKDFPYKCEVPKMYNFKGKEYPRDHLR